MFYNIVVLTLYLFSTVISKEIKNESRICVIGAGMSGLSAAYYLQEAGLKHIDVFETSSNVGGTWVYDPRIGEDEQGLPIHSSMYKNLRTNLPRETMEFPSYPMPPETPSFPSGKCFYEYILKFADHFNLRKYIKFSHQVTSVSRINNIWKVQYRKIQESDVLNENEYDYILVCSGHNNHPNWPDNIDEIRKHFNGTITHSHDYREPSPFEGKRVLVVGAGPSAWDIGIEVATVATQLIHSHHSKQEYQTPFPNNYLQKPDVKEVSNSKIVFDDDSSEDVDVIIYCTGYHYYYPFLDNSSELTMAMQYIAPLYRNTVNINQPTMLFFGLGVHGVVSTAIHVQARYAAALIIGNFTLPSKNDMTTQWEQQRDDILSKGKPLKVLHDLGPYEEHYYEGLTIEAKIEGVPPIMAAMGRVSTEYKFKNWYNFRYYNFNIFNRTYFSVEQSSVDKLCY